MLVLVAAVFLAGIYANGCSRGADGISLVLPPQGSDPPAGAGSSEPSLFAAPNGPTYLSWIEPDGDAHALLFSVRTDGKWSAPKQVAAGDNWFINWADVPAVIAVPGGSLVAHWLQSTGNYAYDVRIARSSDSGKQWSEGVTPYADSAQVEHGFVSLLPWNDGGVLAVWLDGRKKAGEEHRHAESSQAAMTLRMAIMDKHNHPLREAQLDERVCDCCQTSAARTANGAVIVYRDRSSTEIRDVSIIRMLNDGTQTEGRPVFEDGWQIQGCPVNGPAIAAAGTKVVVVWYTAANNASRVRAAFSDDEGETFGLPIRIDDGDPMGRVRVTLLPDGSAIAAWMEVAGDGADIRVRRLSADGKPGESYTVARSSQERASGFPVLASNNHEVVVSWTEVGDESKVRAASIALE